MGCYFDVPVWWDVLSSDWQQHRRHEENMEPQIHIEEPFRRDPRFDVSSRRAGSHHRFRGPHAQDVESAEDGTCQKVRTSPSIFQTPPKPWLIDSYWPKAEQFQICIDFLSGPSCSALSDMLILSLRCVQFRHFTPDAADRAPLERKALLLMSPIRMPASVYSQTVTRFSHMKLSLCDKELTTICSTALIMSHHGSVAHTQSGVMWWVYF